MRTTHQCSQESLTRCKFELQHRDACCKIDKEFYPVQDLFPDILKISPNNVEYLEKVHSNVRRKLSRPQNDGMEQININAMIWGIFKSATMKAAVHLGRGVVMKKICVPPKNTDFEKIKPLIWDAETDPWPRTWNTWKYPRLIRIQFHGWEVLRSTTKPSSYRQQKCTSSQIRCFVSEAELLSTHDLWWLEKTELVGLRNLFNFVSWTMSMENQSCSSEKICPGHTKPRHFQEVQSTREKKRLSTREIQR